MTTQNRAATALTLLLLSLSGCLDQPTASTPAVDAPAPLATLRCDVNVGLGILSCQGAEAGVSGGARPTVVTVGGQHHYVRLANSGTVFDAATGAFSTNVTVQNLLLAAMGTADGTSPDASGVRVFFASGPTNGVTVANAAGQAVFLSSQADYFQYSGAELGGDGVLSPDETSTGKTWTFNTRGASTFAFSVYVQAAVPTAVAHTAHFVQVTSGGSHSCGLTQAGVAYCWGGDGNGRLGNGTTLTVNQGVPSPVQMPAGVTFTSISAGSNHTCALGSDSRGYCWGSDMFGRLGNGTPTEDQHSPSLVQMPAGVTFTSISAGLLHTCAVGSDSRGYCWGTDSGRLGNGTTLTADQDIPSPVEMPAGVTFTSITAGSYHTCATGSDSRGYCWGTDGNGQLGNGTALTEDQHSPSLVQMPAGVTFTSISAGVFHTCAVGSDSRGYCWGTEGNGQLGNGTALTEDQHSPSLVQMPAGVTFTSVSAGSNHTCALGSDSRGYCWGFDGSGRLGNGTTLTADQHAPSPVEMPAGVTFTSISAGKNNHTCAVGPAPSYCWAANSSRQVGDGTAVQRAAPVVVAGTR